MEILSFKLGRGIKVLKSPPSAKIAVIAPHPDDELLGCGGTLIKHIRQKDRVTVIYVTDGQTGDPQGLFRDHDYVSLRRQEARDGLEKLNIKDAVFLGFMDRRIKPSREILAALFNTLRQIGPEIIYFPSRWESLPDHRQTARVMRVLSRRLVKATSFMEYEIHSRNRPNTIIDVTDVYGIKVEALKQHLTQLACHDYLSLIKGLNAYRAKHQNIFGGYAEAFYCWTN